jgi:hypothetical protein
MLLKMLYPAAGGARARVCRVVRAAPCVHSIQYTTGATVRSARGRAQISRMIGKAPLTLVSLN